MKLNKAHIVTVIVAFAVGLAGGIILETSYGVGTILKAIGVSSQTQATGTNETSIPDKYQGKLQ
ncbi:MAG TPA: hypothetical protein V6C95_11275, partial [Coleofasciculaceae cyanobacterium]